MGNAVLLDSYTGGLWYYTDHVRPNEGAGAYEDLITNDGKELMAFSDYPIPEEYSMVKINPAASHSNTLQMKLYLQLPLFYKIYQVIVLSEYAMERISTIYKELCRSF